VHLACPLLRFRLVATSTSAHPSEIPVLVFLWSTWLVAFIMILVVILMH
jgi:hypothetical protein